MASEEQDKFDCPLCGISGTESEIVTHLDTCDGQKKVFKTKKLEFPFLLVDLNENFF